MVPREESSGAARFLVTTAALFVVIYGLKVAKDLIIPFLIAVVFAVLCAPAVYWLRKKRVPAFLAVLLVFVVLIALLSGIGALVGGSVNEFVDSIPRYKERIGTLGDKVEGWLEGLPLPWEISRPKLFEMVELGDFVGLLGDGLKGLISTLSNTVLVMLTLMFMLFESIGLPVKVKAALGSRDADLSRFAKGTREVQHYLAIKTGLSLITGGLIAIWLTILGLDFALVWGLLAFLLNYIPNLGSIIAAVPAILLAIVQLGPGSAILVTIGFLVVNMALGNVVEPHLMGRKLGLSTLVVFLSLVFWGWVWGPVGMLLSVPLTMMCKILLENSKDLQWVAILLDSGSSAEELLELTAPPQEEPADEG
jgi:predicted PurR-regulated permease PerM